PAGSPLHPRPRILPPAPAHTPAVDTVDGADDDLRQGSVGHLHVRRQRSHPSTVASCTWSRNEVEYSPLWNCSLPRISYRTSRVVGTPSISSSSSARRARPIARSRSLSSTTTFAIIES